ncbi:hypothetical protein ACWDA7_38400 [Streptomyces sp. NPDC001156]
MVIELSVRRLFCDNGNCARVTFAEQVDGLTSRYGRRTPVRHQGVNCPTPGSGTESEPEDMRRDNRPPRPGLTT